MIIFWAGFAAAIVALIASYAIAGRDWGPHAVLLRIRGQRLAISGALGELTVFILCSLLLLILGAVSHHSSITQIVATYGLLLTAFFFGLLVFQSLSGWGIGGKTTEGSKSVRLASALLCYRIYASIFLTGVLAALLILYDHASVQLLAFEQLAEAPRAKLENRMPANIETFVTTLEWSALDMQMLLRSNYDILDPTLVFAVGIFVINLFVLMTPLRWMSAIGQTHQTLWSLMVALITLGAVCVWLYSVSYYPTVNAYMHALEAYGANLKSAPPDAVQRYAEIVLDFSVQKTAYWFVSNMIFSNGGALILIGLATSQVLFETVLRWRKKPNRSDILASPVTPD
ncbi:hypothetical protein [Henriciella litoralis]|uniref:hypothetical protein n=1 Tax=Henriciella litoralis TaxID=568102 RepID=UPI0009FD55ED|nr:hypothetical protein [Henriciella litoralis]